ncbi:MAG: hypothetical protein Q4G69_12640 [Planctomycetia bacterium]|nr:hypothetical protein [Planctomycetia bacterium]
MKKFLLLVGCVALITFSACGPKVPSDVPKLIPCSVKVTKGGSPLEGAQVILYKTEGAGSLTVCGTTDASGVAKISTIRASYVGKGAPEGDYKVTVNKEVVVPHWKTPDELAAMTPPEAEKYDSEMTKKREALPRIVPKDLSDQSKSPLTAKVTSAGGEILVVDVDTAAKGAAAPAPKK